MREDALGCSREVGRLLGDSPMVGEADHLAPVGKVCQGLEGSARPLVFAWIKMSSAALSSARTA